MKLEEQAEQLVDETVDGATLHDYLFLQGDWAQDSTEPSKAAVPGEGQEAAERPQVDTVLLSSLSIDHAWYPCMVGELQPTVCTITIVGSLL